MGAHDADAESKVTYTISGDYANWLSIDRETGAISTAKVLDFESMPSLIEFDCTAADHGDMQTTGFVVVEIINVNDNKPLLTFPTPKRPVIQIGDVFFNYDKLHTVPNGKLLSVLTAIDHDEDDVKFEMREQLNTINLDEHGQLTMSRNFNKNDD